MARVALIFLFAFCVFQLTSAAPLDEKSPTIEDSLKNLQNIFEATFSKDNIEKMQSDLVKFGEKLAEHGKAIKEKAEKEMSKLNEQTSTT